MREAGVVLGGRYRLLERIASGGMGTVWEARDETLHRQVAVKVLNEGLSSDRRFTERFRREARHAAGLSHPNIAGVFDYGEDDGRPYIVMELIDGEDLAQRLERRTRLDPQEAERIAGGVALALSHAHSRGIVHRDVKPANVMLTNRGDVVVTDFGIAAPLEGSTGLTVTGAVMGTSRYISPEQAAGERATPASDVYSLGVVLYEMLAGGPPFVRDTPVATALAHMNDDPPDVREARPETPAELAAIVHACLAKDPAARPPATALTGGMHPDGLPLQVAPTPDDHDEPEDTTTVLPLGTVGAQRAEATRPLTVPTAGPSMPPLGTARSAPRDPRRSWLLASVLVALALFLVGVLTSGSLVTLHVPKLIGLPQAEARTRALGAGLDPRVRIRTSDTPAGFVFVQHPLPGRTVPTGMAVVLYVSSGPAVVPPPPEHPTPPKKPHEDHGKGHGHKERH